MIPIQTAVKFSHVLEMAARTNRLHDMVDLHEQLARLMKTNAVQILKQVGIVDVRSL